MPLALITLGTCAGGYGVSVCLSVCQYHAMHYLVHHHVESKVLSDYA